MSMLLLQDKEVEGASRRFEERVLWEGTEGKGRRGRMGMMYGTLLYTYVKT